MRYFSLLFVLCLTPQSWGKVSYPEVFEQFISGWVEYDEGAYAASYRAFRRAHALDPHFYPARDACVASLARMNMPEMADFYMRYTSRKVRERFKLEPKLAFWGVFYDDTFSAEDTDALAEPLISVLRSAVSIPVVEVSPTSRAWEDRQKMTPCQYNMFVLLTANAEGLLIARIHLIEAFNVEGGNELELAAELPQLRQVQHRKVTVNLDKTGLPQFLKTAEGRDELLGLLQGRWQSAVLPFVMDAETAALPDMRELADPAEIVSKLAVVDEPWRYYVMADLKVNNGSFLDRDLISNGFLAWLLTITPFDSPHRPWLLGAAGTFGGFNHFQKWYPERFQDEYGTNDFTAELLTRYPNHVMTEAVRFNNAIRLMTIENYPETAPGLLAQLRMIKGSPETEIMSWRGRTSLGHAEQRLAFFAGETKEPKDYPRFPFHVIARADKDSYRYTLGPNYNIMVGSPSYDACQIYAAKMGKDQAYSLEAWRMLELSPYGFLENPVPLQQKHKAMLKEAPDSPYLKSCFRKIEARMRQHGQSEILSRTRISNVNRALGMIRTNEPWIDIFSALPGEQIQDSSQGQIVSAINKRFHRYRRAAIGRAGADKFLFVIEAYGIDLSDLDPQVKDTVYSDVLSSLQDREAGWNEFNDFTKYMEGLHKSKHPQEFSDLLTLALPHVRRISTTFPILHLRMKICAITAQMLILDGAPRDALEFVEIGLAQYYAEPMQAVDKRESRQSSRLKERFRLLAVKAEALLALSRHEDVVQLIDATLLELDGRSIQYLTWEQRGHVGKTIGKRLLALRDKSEAQKLQ